jgi:hypothetical protein
MLKTASKWLSEKGMDSVSHCMYSEINGDSPIFSRAASSILLDKSASVTVMFQDANKGKILPVPLGISNAVRGFSFVCIFHLLRRQC